MRKANEISTDTLGTELINSTMAAVITDEVHSWKQETRMVHKHRVACFVKYNVVRSSRGFQATRKL